MALTQIKAAGLTADLIDETKLADDSIDSEHYNDASIDHQHLANDCIDGDNLVDNAVDSEHYTDGSIDNEHLADNAVDLAEMAHGTQGDVLYYGSGGAPTRLSAGTDGQFLKTQGSSANPTWATVSTTDTKSFRNILYNGAMEVSQRGTVANAGNEYGGPDRWYFFKNDGAFTVSQETDVPTGQGFASSYKIDCTSVSGTAGVNYVALQQKLEGRDLQKIKKGTSNAESLTLSFWIKTTKTGTYIAELYDEDNNRHCSKSYTVSSSDTWEQKSVTFPADTTGTFDNNQNLSLSLRLWVYAGSTYTSGTLATSWQADTAANRCVGQVNAGDNTSNNIFFTGIQLELGTTATDFEHRTYQDYFFACRRYYQDTDYGQIGYGNGSHVNAWQYVHYTLSPPMRTTPSTTLGGTDVQGTNASHSVHPFSHQGQCFQIMFQVSGGNATDIYASGDDAEVKLDAEL